jgi:hypothetical protein
MDLIAQPPVRGAHGGSQEESSLEEMVGFMSFSTCCLKVSVPGIFGQLYAKEEQRGILGFAPGKMIGAEEVYGCWQVPEVRIVDDDDGSITVKTHVPTL